MPKFKSVTLNARNKAGTTDTLRVDVHIDSGGVFYAHLPERLRDSLQREFVSYVRRSPTTLVASAHTFDSLMGAITKAHYASLNPEVTEELVIRYNIESHCTFAVDSKGNICPNAGFPDAQWPNHRTGPDYGDHSANAPSKGGYSLTVGAEALIKHTYRFGDNTRVKYERFYGEDDSHHDHNNPASLLNSWRCFYLDDKAKEIPYSDEAAMFFHRLLLGIAELSRKIQEATFTPARLKALIESSSGVPLIGVDSGHVAPKKRRGAR